MYLVLDCDTADLIIKFKIPSQFIGGCFLKSSRKDQLIEVVRNSVATGIWDPCLQDLDNRADWERFAALTILVAAVGLDQPCRDDVLHSFRLPNFIHLSCWFDRLKTGILLIS